MSETRVEYSILLSTVERKTLEDRIFRLREELNEALKDKTVAEIERDQLDAALADELARSEALKHNRDSALLIMHSDRTAKEIAVQRYIRLETLCRQLTNAYGNNSVDFHRTVALIRQHLEA